jgi:hypothetical protein
VGVATRPTSSQSKAWRCCPAFSSKTAVAVNIAIMRAFVELRRVAASYAAIERRLGDFERETKATLGQHDQQLDEIFEALRQLISPPPRPTRPVGFRLPEGDK